MTDANINALTEKITIVLKDGRVKPLEELTRLDFRGIYEKWEYGGLTDPIGQFGGWILGKISELLAPIQNQISWLWTYYIKPAFDTLWNSLISPVLNTIRGYVDDIPDILTILRDLRSRVVDPITSYIGSAITGLWSTYISPAFSSITPYINRILDILNTLNDLRNRFIEFVSSGINLQLTSFWNNYISKGFNDLWAKLQTVPTNLGTVLGLLNQYFPQMSSFINYAMGSLRGLTSSLQSAYNVIENIRSQVLNMPSLFGNLGTLIGNTVNILQQLITGQFTRVSTFIHTQIQGVIQFVKDLPSMFNQFPSIVNKFISDVMKQFNDAIRPIIDFTTIDLPKRVEEVRRNLETQFNNLINSFTIPTPDGKPKSIWEIIQDVGRSLDRQSVAFMGFTNPLERLRSFLEVDVFDIGKWIWEGLDKAFKGSRNLIDGFIKWASVNAENIYNLIENVHKWFKDVIKPEKGQKTLFDAWCETWVGERLTSVFNWDNAKKVFKFVIDKTFEGIKWFMEQINNALKTIFDIVKASAREIYKTFVEPSLNAEWTLKMEGISPLAKIYAKLIPEQQKVYQMWNTECIDVFKGIWNVQLSLIMKSPIFDLLLSAIALYSVSSLSGLLDKIEVALSTVFAKIGAKIDPKAIKSYLRDWAKEGLKEWAKTMIFTFSFWIFEPVKYILNPYFRGYLPIEVPTLHEIIEIARRYMPDNAYITGSLAPSRYGEIYKDIENYVYDTLAKRGYPLWFDNVVIKGHKEYNTIVYDRFNTKRVIPSALLFSLPAPSDCVRMMLRDMIQSLDDFNKIMLMHGFHPDVSALYFMLHFRYPSTERLFEFACRVASGLTWVDKGEEGLKDYFEYIKEEKSNFTKWGLGFEPRTPKEIADEIDRKYPLSDLTKLTKIASSRVAEAFAPLGRYFKWHDLFPMAWLKGYTSDQMIAMELSADIPMRIDARWMYKWGVISDRELAQIVIARGMHPKWVEKIAIAEMMNAMAEERTIVRTGIMNSFKEGFFIEDRLYGQLTNLTTIKLLDREVPVKFLEGEAKLMILRSKYDRALDILLNAQKSLFMAYSENMIEYSRLKDLLRSLTTTVATQLKIPLHFDDLYYDTYREGLDVRKDYETVSRIRRWMRYAILEVMNRVRSGYLSDTEIRSALNIIKSHARLTDADIDYFYDLAKLMKTQADRSILVQSILKKLSKGLITREEAMNQMLLAGLEQNVAEAMIELHAKTYTLSISQYLSYANYIPIPSEWIDKKLDLLGVPEDERRLILTIFDIRPVSDEINALIKQFLNEFEYGYIDETTLRSHLSAMGVLPKSIDILVNTKKVEKSMNIKKLLVDNILNKLKRGVISVETAISELKKFIVDDNIIESLIETKTRTYTLSVSQYLSYANYIDIPVEYLEKKLDLLGVPEDEKKLILTVFEIKPISNERDALIKRYLDEYENGYVDENTVKENLRRLGLRSKAVNILIEMKRVEKSMNAKKILVDSILSKLRRGVIKLKDAINELKKYIVDESLIYALIEKHIRTYTFSPDKMISMMEYVPIDMNWLIEKAKLYGYPEEEIKLIPAYAVSREISEEVKRLANELGQAFAEGIITEEEYVKALDELATLGGQAKTKFGVDWIVLSPEERYVLVQIYKTRAIRKLYSKRS